ncbi:MAG: Rrf2 family transcriptional regulator [Planctomycetes bacterium]|nr:Rrf2 family transcriptional regulator [Planctomycetota bacterium]
MGPLVLLSPTAFREGREMKLSRASTYALYGLAYLAAQAAGRRVPLSEIGRYNGVPEKHLGKIFVILKRSRILASSRGVNGGFYLARSPRDVSLLEVIEAVDGPLRDDGCLLTRKPCQDFTACRLNLFWKRARTGMLGVLAAATLSDIAGPTPALLKPGKRFSRSARRR